MRTTIDINDALLRRAKTEAARTNRPLRQVIEDALMESLSRAPQAGTAQPVKLPVSRRTGGPRPGVDLDHSADLLDVMEANGDPA